MELNTLETVEKAETEVAAEASQLKTETTSALEKVEAAVKADMAAVEAKVKEWWQETLACMPERHQLTPDAHIESRLEHLLAKLKEIL